MTDAADDLDHLPYNHPLRKAARHHELLRQHEETVARHQANPAVQEWLRQFRDDGQGLLKSFAEKRTASLTTGREAGLLLAEIPERHPIVAAADWREALHHPWLNRRKQLLAAALREAFARYETPRERPHPF